MKSLKTPDPVLFQDISPHHCKKGLPHDLSEKLEVQSQKKMKIWPVDMPQPLNEENKHLLGGQLVND
jgi:hypothetical protein